MCASALTDVQVYQQKNMRSLYFQLADNSEHIFEVAYIFPQWMSVDARNQMNVCQCI